MTKRIDRDDRNARTAESTTDGQPRLADLDARQDPTGGFPYNTLRFGVSVSPGYLTGNIPTQLG